MKAVSIERCLGWGALRASLCAAVLALTMVARAAPLPPSDPWTELPIATLATKPATALQMGRIKVWLEFNTLAEVMRVAGANQVARHEDDKDSYDWICYDADAHRQRLWFVSDTDTGGERHIVTSIVAAMVLAPAGDANACPLLPKVLNTMALDRSIWLGTSDGDLSKKLGEPSAVRHDWRSFYSVHRVLAPRQIPNQRPTKYDDVDESSYLNVHLVDGRIVELVASKLTGE